jgi:histone acetyltransferase 1
VEDPAEAFEDLRDRNDLRMLLSLDDFMTEGFGSNSTGGSGIGPIRSGARARVRARGKMGPPVEKAWAERWRTKLKIAGVGLPSSGQVLISIQIFVPATISAPRRDAHSSTLGSR